jgi:hypothetical protein
MQNMVEKTMYLRTMNTNVSRMVYWRNLASSHGRRISYLTTPISVVVLSSVHSGFLLLHIARKCIWLYIFTVVTEYTEQYKSERQMKTEEACSSKRK